MDAHSESPKPLGILLVLEIQADLLSRIARDCLWCDGIFQVLEIFFEITKKGPITSSPEIFRDAMMPISFDESIFAQRNAGVQRKRLLDSNEGRSERVYDIKVVRTMM